MTYKNINYTKTYKQHAITAKLVRVATGVEGAAEALEPEAGGLVPVPVGVVEAEGDLEVVVLFRHGHLVVGVHVPVPEDVGGLQRPLQLSERGALDTRQVLKQTVTVRTLLTIGVFMFFVPVAKRTRQHNTSSRGAQTMTA